MAEDGGVCVRRSGKERGSWLGIGQRVEEKRGDSWGLGCSIHPSAGLSRCVPRELGSGGQGRRQGHHHRWCKCCIHEDGWAVGVTATGNPDWIFFFCKKSSIKLPKKQKNKYKYACGLMTETDTHTHASNDSYEHPPR